MAEIRDADTAAHEAAHVVVGLALGLRLRRAVVRRHTLAGVTYDGYALFTGGRHSAEALALMHAAGVAHERAVGGLAVHAAADFRAVREYASSRRGVEALVVAAAAILAGRQREHARMTRALLAHDLSGADIRAICHSNFDAA